MRAFAMTDFDAVPALTDLDVPEPAEGEVRVRIRAASVNGFDLAVATGHTKDYMEHRFPLVLGKDFAGEVDAVGTSVTDYAVGDRVFGTVTKPYLGDGSFAEYVIVPTAIGIAKLPENVSFTDGAGLGLAGAAAYGIIDAAALQPGQTLLVAGATGGVGTQVVQLAAAAGARVIATAHTDAERELVSRLGAEVVVDHQADLASQVRAVAPDGVDAVAHLAGDASVVELVREGGRFASTLLQSPEQLPAETATVVPVFANPTPETLARCAASQANGETTVAIQEVFPSSSFKRRSTPSPKEPWARSSSPPTDPGPRTGLAGPPLTERADYSPVPTNSVARPVPTGPNTPLGSDTFSIGLQGARTTSSGIGNGGLTGRRPQPPGRAARPIP